MKNFLKRILKDESGIAPAVLAALIAGGSQLAGAGISGIGAGMSAEEMAEEERKKREQDQMNLDRQFAQNKKMDTQQSGMQGIQLLMALQAQADKQFKGQRFRDAALSAIKGG